LRLILGLMVPENRVRKSRNWKLEIGN